MEREVTMLRTRVVGICILVMWTSSLAQDHVHGTSERLGVVHFATSCKSEAQKDFDRATALLHSFQFSSAIQGYNTALKDDETCGIAYWGIALSDWSNPFAAGLKDKGQLQTGRESVQRGQTTGAKTDRERAYLSAVANLYRDFENTPQRTRLLAYRDAMPDPAAREAMEEMLSAVLGFYGQGLLLIQNLLKKQAPQVMQELVADPGITDDERGTTALTRAARRRGGVPGGGPGGG